MYKVFIDNRPIIFQIYQQSADQTDLKKIWSDIHDFLKSSRDELVVQIGKEEDFQKVFHAFKKIDAAGGLVHAKGKYLFIFRNGFWDIPKGKLEKEEDPVTAAVREVEEECGLLSPRIIKPLVTTYHTYEMKGKQVLKRTFWYLMEEGNPTDKLVPQTEEGISEVRYFHPDEFAIIRENTFQSIIEVLDSIKE